MTQAKGLSKKEFAAWMKQSNFPRAYKADLSRALKPVLSASRFEAVLLRGVKLRGSDQTRNLILVGVAPALRKTVSTDVFVIYENPAKKKDKDDDDGEGKDDKLEFCHYSSCYQGTCYQKQTHKVKGTPCPESNCDACKNSSPGSGKGIFETLAAF